MQNPDQPVSWRDVIDSCIDGFELLWKDGRSPRVEKFLFALPKRHLERLVRELVAVELAYRRQRGEAPEFSEYSRRFPDQAAMLREVVWNTRDLEETIPPPQLNERFGKYHLVRQIGDGAMGTVFEAHCQQSGQEVAIKVSRFKKELSWRNTIRFQRESELLQEMNHPNIIRSMNQGKWRGWRFIVMELLPGPTLAAHLKTHHRLNAGTTVHLAQQVVSAVKYLETKEIIHRDINPKNLMFGPRGELKLIDFGLARKHSGMVSITSEGCMIGTPGYLSPESAAGLVANDSSEPDLYAAGCIVYQLLTGTIPQTNIADQGPRVASVFGPDACQQALGAVGVPGDLASIVSQTIAGKPSERFFLADELLEQLERFQTGKRVVDHQYCIRDEVRRCVRRLVNWFRRDRTTGRSE